MPSFPKTASTRSEAYRRAVAALPCLRCGIEGHTQAAHGDAGKGLSLKSSDLTCYPLCGPHDGEPGCHYVIGMTGTLSKAERRWFEEQSMKEAQEKLKRNSEHDPKLRGLLIRLGLLA
jgi:hypothetical protein